MSEDNIMVQRRLRHRLQRMIGWTSSTTATDSCEPTQALCDPFDPTAPVDVLITCNEINDRHGTGVLVRRIFGDGSDLVHLRSCTNYGGQTFGRRAFILPTLDLTRAQIYHQVSRWLEGINVRRAVCIPYFQQDALVAQAVKDIFDVPYCVYLMDDNNMFSGNISNEVMDELLRGASARLAISGEMKRAYEAKFRYQFHLLPPAVDPVLIAKEIKLASPLAIKERRGALVGNIWGQRWLDLLRATVRNSGIEIDWYCNQGKHLWLNYSRESLESDGIYLHVALPEEELVSRLPDYCFALLPSGTLDETDDNAGVAALSLPSRIPFILSAAQTPFLVMGNPDTTSARFVQRFGLGVLCDYSTESFRSAVTTLANEETQLQCRSNAYRLGNKFPSHNIANWIWHTVETGDPPDDRFEEALGAEPGEFQYYSENVPKNWILPDFSELYKALWRLKKNGINPNCIIDVGASTGIWSDIASKVFSSANFVLVEPLLNRYKKADRGSGNPLKKSVWIEKALYCQKGTQKLNLSKNLYGSSLLPEKLTLPPEEVVEVETTTLDELSKELSIDGSVLLKLDVQGAERMIIEGGRRFIENHVDVIIIEMSLKKGHVESPAANFMELTKTLVDLDFQLVDRCGEWCCPSSGFMQEFDGLFIKNSCLTKPAKARSESTCEEKMHA